MTMNVITVDGSMGEGGGQILRASLALSMALGKAFCMENIRANRPKPGLKRQHLTCVKAAEDICGATVSGGDINSTSLSFAPGVVRAGEYRFDIGSGGSVTLVLQAVVPPLLTADGPSRITVTGGTHVPYAPPFEFMQMTFFPWLEKLGPQVTATMARPGFMQIGGGSVTVDIVPSMRLKPLTGLHEPGRALGAEATIYCHNLSTDIARRETDVLLSKSFADLKLSTDTLVLKDGKEPRQGTEGAGNAVLITLKQEQGITVFGEIGWRGKAAEKVASQAAKRALAFKESGAAVERHLADQLLVPMALAGGGSFVAESITPHTRTCLELLPLFMDIKVTMTQEDEKSVRVTLK